MMPDFTELPNLIPELVPKLIERGDHTLAHLYIDLNSTVREVYETMTELMEDPTLDFEEMHRHMNESKGVLEQSLELFVLLIERHPDLSLWVTKEMAVQQLSTVKETQVEFPWE